MATSRSKTPLCNSHVVLHNKLITISHLKKSLSICRIKWAANTTGGLSHLSDGETERERQERRIKYTPFMLWENTAKINFFTHAS